MSCGISMPGRKLSVLNGRRGPSAPGPGATLLIRCDRCRCNPREPRYPNSNVVSRPRLFEIDKLHCWMYCEGACGSKAAKLTVVLPRAAGAKSKPLIAGIKLSLCCVSGNTNGTL